MPAYMSHALFGEELYKNLIVDNKLLKVNLYESELRGYSLGIDLVSLSKHNVYDPHKYDTREFFLQMINYIKNNQLRENKHILALLYGHIAHYFLDLNVHPLVYYHEHQCKSIGRISNHHLIEGYFDSYLVNKIKKIDIMNLKDDYFNQIDLHDEDTKRLLNNVYGVVYNNYQVVNDYKKVLMVFTMLEKFIKSGLFSKEFLIKFSKFDEFMKINHLTYDKLTNENNSYINPFTNQEQFEDLLTLFYKSLDMTLETIKKVNDCLYKDISLSTLESSFQNRSYISGLLCEEKSYVKK